MKGPSEKGDQFAVLEYEMKLDMKGGPMVTHPCDPPPKNGVHASSSGEHVQLFRMVYDRKKGCQAKHL